MNKILLIISTFCLLALAATAQTTNSYKGLPSLIWPKLYNIRFEKAKDNLGEYDKPVFSKDTKALNGKIISLPGYMVPFDKGTKGQRFILTSLPLSACFFCGVGGPESVIEVYLKEPIQYTEKPIEVKGTLKLNDTNPDKMIYILENAEFLGEIEF